MPSRNKERAAREQSQAEHGQIAPLVGEEHATIRKSSRRKGKPFHRPLSNSCDPFFE